MTPSKSPVELMTDAELPVRTLHHKRSTVQFSFYLECGYNLIETAERFDEPDLEMFLLMSSPEQLFYDCMAKFLKRYLLEVSTRYRTEAVPSLVLPPL
jgi:hypothetical protein